MPPHDFPLEGDEAADEAPVIVTRQRTISIWFQTIGRGGVTAACGETIILGLTLSLLRSRKSQKGSKPASLGTHLFLA